LGGEDGVEFFRDGIERGEVAAEGVDDEDVAGGVGGRGDESGEEE
jgi:hypothetical protein